MSNVREMLSTKVVTTAGVMIALNVILNLFVLPIGNIIEVSFAFIPILFAGYLLGPVIAGAVGTIGDLLGFIIRPAGFFFPGFTFNALMSGVIYGLFLYNKPITLKRVAIATIVERVVISVILTPIWLQMMYGTALFSVPRIIKVIVMLPIEILLSYQLLKKFSYRMENMIFDRGAH